MKGQCSVTLLDKLHLDKACLQLHNDDSEHTIEIWGQASECYACSPWKYVSVAEKDTDTMIVNSTYSTNLYFLLPHNETSIHRFNYHFAQHGVYGITFNSTSFQPIETIKPGNNEYLLILYMVLLFGFICSVSHFTKRTLRWLGRRRNSSETMDPLIEGSDEDPIFDRDSPSSIAVEQRSENAVQVGDQRLLSLDTFRGLSIVIMIFANYGGGRFYFFKHAPWNGLTVADLVFPWFLWIMGVCITLSLRSQLRKDITKTSITWKIIQRSIKLFWLGTILNSAHDNNLHTLRIMGVLQRLSVCYLVIGLVEVVGTKKEDSVERNSWQWQIRDIYKAWFSWLFTAALVTTHVLCTFLLQVPNCPSGYLGPGGLHEQSKYLNCTGGAAGYVDRLILGPRHMYKYSTSRVIYDGPEPFDPEGLLSSMTACLSVVLGVAAGRIILCFPGHRQRIVRWCIWSVSLGFLGACLCGWSKETGPIPVNKNLWSLSYVLVTASFAFCLLAAIYVLVDVRKWWSGRPFSVAGLNSIFIYCGHEIASGMLPFCWQPLANNHASHLIMNVSGTSLWIVIAYWMHARSLYFVV